MCPFCIGAAAWVAAGTVSAGGLGAIAAVVHRQRAPAPSDGVTTSDPSATPDGRADGH